MITLALFILAIVAYSISLYFIYKWCKNNRKRYTYEPFYWLLVPLIIIIVAFFGIGIASFTSQNTRQNQAVTDVLAVKLSKDKAANIIALIKPELDKYPEIEKSVLKNLDPKFILSFPQLKSNETITKLAQEMEDLNKEIYDEKGWLLHDCRVFRTNKSNPFYMTIIPVSSPSECKGL